MSTELRPTLDLHDKGDGLFSTDPAPETGMYDLVIRHSDSTPHVTFHNVPLVISQRAIVEVKGD